MGHGRGSRWLAQEHGPYAGPRKPRRSPLDWSTRYLRERWEAGERNGAVLWEELKTQGYTGSMRSVYRRLAPWRDHPRKLGSLTSTGFVARSPLEDMTPGQVIGWMVARPETLTPEVQELLDRLCQMDGTLAQAREPTQRWLDFIRHHAGEELDTWLKDVRASTVRGLLPFAQSRERDKAVILAGLMLPYSTGPVEGRITRLKLIKRQAYGRASLSYLQRRFLPTV